MSNHEPAFHTELVSFQGPAYAGHASLMVTAKRYVPLDTTRTWGGENEFTLVLAHCIGSRECHTLYTCPASFHLAAVSTV